MLAADGAARYLLERELIAARSVVETGLRVADCSRLNRVFVATTGDGRSLVLKEGPGVAREAAILARLDRLLPALPVLVAHDPTERVLVLEAAPGGRDLDRHHAGGRYSRALAEKAGRALGRLHRLPADVLAGLSRPAGSRAPPHRPDLATLRTLSSAEVELTRVVQRSAALCAALDELLGDRRHESVVHGDVRWSNCVVSRPAGSGWSRLELIDWELCGAGDPALDAGAFLAEYLRAWLQSIPIADPRDPGRLAAHARRPLWRMRPALRAFWDAYARHRRPEPEELRRAVRFAGVRLVTAAFEQAHVRDELRADVYGLLAPAEKLLRRPDDAVELLGLA